MTHISIQSLICPKWQDLLQSSLTMETMIQQSNMSSWVKCVNSDPPSTILQLEVPCCELEVTLLSKLSFKRKVGSLYPQDSESFFNAWSCDAVYSLVTRRRINLKLTWNKWPHHNHHVVLLWSACCEQSSNQGQD